MAIQQQLSDISITETVKAPSGGYSVPTAQTGTAQVFSGLSELLSVADKGISLFEKVDTKYAVEDFNKNLTSIIESQSQKSITASEARTRVNNLITQASKDRPELLQTFIQATEQAYGAVPFKTERSAQEAERQQAMQTGFAVLGGDATPRDAENKGREILNAKAKAAVAQQQLEALVRNKQISSSATVSAGIEAVNAVIENNSLLGLSSLGLEIGRSASNLDEKAAADTVFSGVRNLIQQTELEVLQTIRSVTDPEAREKILESWNRQKETFNNIFNPETGALDLKSTNAFYQAAKAQAGYSAVQSFNLLSQIKEVLGPEATGKFMNTILMENPQTQGAFLKMLQEQALNLVQGNTVGQNRINNIFKIATDKNASKILALDPDARFTELSAMGNKMLSSMTAATGQKFTDVKQSENALSLSINLSNIAISNLTRPENINVAAKQFSNPQYKVMFDRIKTTPGLEEVANEAGQRISVLASKNIFEQLNQLQGNQTTPLNKIVSYNAETGKLVVESDSRIVSDLLGYRGVGAISNATSAINKAKEYVDNVNSSLNLLTNFKEYDSVTKNMTDNKVKEFILFNAKQSIGNGLLENSNISKPTVTGSPATITEGGLAYKPTRRTQLVSKLAQLERQVGQELEESRQRMILFNKPLNDAGDGTL